MPKTPHIGPSLGPSPTQTDWRKLNEDFNREAQKAIRAYRAEIEKVWKAEAKKKIKSDPAQKKYLAGVSFVATKDGVDVNISGWMPVALEEGAGAFDMKPGLLAGRQYRDIRLESGHIRRVSVMSPPKSWRHPGIEARKIGQEVRKQEPEIHKKTVQPVIDKFLGRITI